MFNGASSFNAIISSWPTDSGQSFESMFKNAFAFDQMLLSWEFSSVLPYGLSGMFSGIKLSTSNYDVLLLNFDRQNITHQNFSGGYSLYAYNSQYSTARADLINNKGWFITDGGNDYTTVCSIPTDPCLHLSVCNLNPSLFPYYNCTCNSLFDDFNCENSTTTPFISIWDISRTNNVQIRLSSLRTSVLIIDWFDLIF